jgi:hypothetical protein
MPLLIERLPSSSQLRFASDTRGAKSQGIAILMIGAPMPTLANCYHLRCDLANVDGQSERLEADEIGELRLSGLQYFVPGATCIFDQVAKQL